jgi:hypothetical protein
VAALMPGGPTPLTPELRDNINRRDLLSLEILVPKSLWHSPLSNLRDVMFNSKLVALIAGLVWAGVGPSDAHASVMYDLTLTATSGGTTNGGGTFTISGAPLTGLNRTTFRRASPAPARCSTSRS